jgi:hypothetical protein
MKGLLPDLLLVVGALAVVVGVALIHVPSAVIVVGAALLGFGLLIVRGTHGRAG